VPGDLGRIRALVEEFGVSERTLRYWVEIGALRRYKVGRSLYLSRQDILDLMTAGERPAVRGPEAS
jgi:DNA-binding transcriptional MerR regulator